MNGPPPALPSNPSGSEHSSRSARWTAGFVITVGFGFMGRALIAASEPTSRAVSARPATAAPSAWHDTGPAAGHAESHEVDLAVRNRTWETPGGEAAQPAAHAGRGAGAHAALSGPSPGIDGLDTGQISSTSA